MATSKVNRQSNIVLDASLFTNLDSHFDTSRFFRRRIGRTIYLTIAIEGGITNGSRLFTIDSSIRPVQSVIVSPIFSSNGSVITNASVWIEANDTSKATFYGTTLPNGLYFATLTYTI